MEDYTTRPYLIQSWRTNVDYERSMALALNAEACVFAGFDALPFEKARMEKGLLSFEMSERYLSRGWLNLFSPRILRLILAYHLGGWKRKNIYKLCIGAFVANDQYRLRTFKNRCYKWGYFIEKNGETLGLEHENFRGPVSIMWCARFLKWKHPEMALKLAERLKNEGYEFTLSMYGEGILKPRMQKMAADLKLTDCVSFRGLLPNNKIHDAMNSHQIFLFTSDENEGWGVVANEAMANQCCLVGANSIGSVPYLVEHGVNGMVFENRSLDSLYSQVKILLDNPVYRKKLAKRGSEDIVSHWSPKRAAVNLLTLIKNLQNGLDSPIQQGPCSVD